MQSRVLIVADRRNSLLFDMVREQGHVAELVAGGEAALGRLDRADRPPISALLLELAPPAFAGLTLLEKLGAFRPPVVAIVDDVETAAPALHAGAVDFVLAPPSPARLRIALANATRIGGLEREVARLGGTPRPRAAPAGVADTRHDAGEATGEALAIADTSGRKRYGVARLVDERGELRSFEMIEEEAIRFAIGHCRGHMSEVARRLGIGRSTLYRKLREYGIAPGQLVAV